MRNRDQADCAKDKEEEEGGKAQGGTYVQQSRDREREAISMRAEN